MKCFNKFLVVTIFLFISLSNVHARTCAEKLVTTEKWLVVGAVASTLIIPLYGIGIATIGLAIASKKIVERNAARLNAASIIAEYQSPDADEMTHSVVKAYKIFDKFYEKLEKKYPNMRLSKNEVIDWLNDVNHMEVGKRACEMLKGYSLGRTFFAEGQMDEWLKTRDEEAEIKRSHSEAAKYRREKNKSFSKQRVFDEDIIAID